jgi:hypothetical protein
MRYQFIFITKKYPRSSHEAPEAYNSTLYLNSALGKCGCLTAHPGRFSPRRETRSIPNVLEAGWAPGAGLDGYGKHRLYQNSIPGPTSP